MVELLQNETADVVLVGVDEGVGDDVAEGDVGKDSLGGDALALRTGGESGEGVPGDDADEVAWLTRAEILEQNLLTAPALLPLIDLAL